MMSECVWPGQHGKGQEGTQQDNTGHEGTGVWAYVTCSDRIGQQRIESNMGLYKTGICQEVSSVQNGVLIF